MIVDRLVANGGNGGSVHTHTRINDVRRTVWHKKERRLIKGHQSAEFRIQLSPGYKEAEFGQNAVPKYNSQQLVFF